MQESLFSCSVAFNAVFILCVVALGQNQPLIHESLSWESDIPLTEGQLLGKRDTFWETAPAYEGRREIWDALRAAAEAAEEEDYELAQAIVTGANVSLPTGAQRVCVTFSQNRDCMNECDSSAPP